MKQIEADAIAMDVASWKRYQGTPHEREHPHVTLWGKDPATLRWRCAKVLDTNIVSKRRTFTLDGIGLVLAIDCERERPDVLRRPEIPLPHYDEPE